MTRCQKIWMRSCWMRAAFGFVGIALHFGLFVVRVSEENVVPLKGSW